MNKLKHTLLIAFCVALGSLFNINYLTQGFIITLAVILFPTFLYIYTDLNPLIAAVATAVISPLFRGVVVYLSNGDLMLTLIMVSPDVVFYFAYGIFFTLIYQKSEKKDVTKFVTTVFLCDFLSNMVEMSVRTRIVGMDITIIKTLLVVAAVRTLIVMVIVISMKRYKSFLIKDEHEARYRSLMLITSTFKSEIYFMNKNIIEIEDVMKKSYTAYQIITDKGYEDELRGLALDIAKDVHEIKKDYIRVIKGLEDISEDKQYTGNMSIKDITDILELDTKEFIRKNALNISLDFYIKANFYVQEHFYLMSILRNLINNSIEAIEKRKKGLLKLYIYSNDKETVFTIWDNGSGIKESNLAFIFNPGFSTKFDEETGSICRGIGLSLVRGLVETTFKGEISVKSEQEKGTTFKIVIPNEALGGEVT